MSSTAKTDPDPGGFVKMMPVEQQGKALEAIAQQVVKVCGNDDADPER